MQIRSDTTHDRTLNTKVYDPDSIVTLHSSNQFRLGAGTYIIEWSDTMPAYDTNEHICAKLMVVKEQDVTNGSTISMGSSEYSGSGLFPSNVQSRSMGEEEKLTVTISTNTDYKIQHWCVQVERKQIMVWVLVILRVD